MKGVVFVIAQGHWGPGEFIMACAQLVQRNKRLKQSYIVHTIGLHLGKVLANQAIIRQAVANAPIGITRLRLLFYLEAA